MSAPGVQVCDDNRGRERLFRLLSRCPPGGGTGTVGRVRRKVVTAAPLVDAGTAMWVRVNVLSRQPSTVPGRKWQGPDLGEDAFASIDQCRCQWGRCGYCQDLGRHDLCAHRDGTAPACDGHETYVISSRRGSALTPVWVKQVFDRRVPGCRWVCPCVDCETETPPPAAERPAPPVQRPPVPAPGQATLF